MIVESAERKKNQQEMYFIVNAVAKYIMLSGTEYLKKNVSTI